MTICILGLPNLVRDVLTGRTTHLHRTVALWALLPLLPVLPAPVDAQDLDAILVKDINATRFPVGLVPRDLTVVGSKMFFLGVGGLWVTDGTLGGTILLEGDDPLFGPLGSRPFALAAAGGKLYFSAFDETGQELWKSDGTVAGTVKVKDINPSVNPRGSGSPRLFTEAGGMVFFSADDGVHGRDLWRTDGTEAGTFMVKDIPGPLFGPDQLTAAGGLLFFTVRTGNFPALRIELWRSDGSEAGTFQVRDINPGGNAGPGPVTVFGGELFFVADDGSGNSLWKSDGTEAGTVKLPPLVGPVQVFLTRVDSTLYYLADGDAIPGSEIWKVDLVSEESEQVSDINWRGSGGTTFRNFTPVGDVLYFTGDDGNTGYELWKHDPATGMTDPVTDFNPSVGAQSFLFFTLTDVEGSLFFAGGPFLDRQLWTSDVTAAGTVEITINPDVGGHSRSGPPSGSPASTALYSSERAEGGSRNSATTWAHQRSSGGATAPPRAR